MMSVIGGSYGEDMTKNGRHRTSGRRGRPGFSRPDRFPRSDGFRPLSLVPPRGAEPEPLDDRGTTDGADLGGSGTGRPGSEGLPSPDPRRELPAEGRSADPAGDRSAPPFGGVGRSNPDHAGSDSAVGPGSDDQGEAARAQARAQEIYDWMQERQRRNPDTGPVRRLEGWKQSPPPPDRPQDAWSSPPPGTESNDRLREALRDIDRRSLDRLVARWGGVEALDHLDTDPLPDEPFAWSGVAADLRPRVERVLSLVDDLCNVWFDVEHRTACRRLLARVAGEPWIVARRGKPETIAGAVVWTIATFNGTVRPRGRRGAVPASYIAGHLGLSSAAAFSQRSIDIQVAAGILLHHQGPEPVGEPGLIVSRQRKHAARRRDKLRRSLG